MKKLIYTFGILIMALSYMACSNGTEEHEEDVAQEETTQEEVVNDAEVSEDTQKDLEEAWNLESEAEQLSEEMDALLDSLEN